MVGIFEIGVAGVRSGYCAPLGSLAVGGGALAMSRATPGLSQWTNADLQLIFSSGEDF